MKSLTSSAVSSMACPVAVLKAWLEVARITEGPVFRPIANGGHVRNARLSDRSVATIIKACATRVGLDPGQYSGHSLRSGFLTSAAARGASMFRMADQSRHKSMDVLRGYVRSQKLFRGHPGAGRLRGIRLTKSKSGSVFFRAEDIEKLLADVGEEG